MNSKIWLSPPHMGLSEKKYVNNAFEENWIAPAGSNIDGFEKDLENYLEENSQAVALSSGTSALHLALILAGVKKDDDVLCQSMTFAASANPIIYLGANPIFIDSEIETWNMCPVALKNAIEGRIAMGKKPKAIIIVHLYGMPAKMDEISTIAKKNEIPLIEDAAEALGSRYNGQKCGTFGDYGILSFNGNKIITTSGGGALICKNKRDKERAIFLSTQAKDTAPHYQHSEIGYNYRMSNVLAGIGRGQMEVLENHIKLRRENNRFYKDIFSNVKGVKLFKEPSKEYFSNHWLSCILINENTAGFSREDLRLELLEKNIESKPLWKPLHLQPVFKDCKRYVNGVSEQLFNNGLCLPSGSNLTIQDKERIKKVILDFIKNKPLK